MMLESQESKLVRSEMENRQILQAIPVPESNVVSSEKPSENHMIETLLSEMGVESVDEAVKEIQKLKRKDQSDNETLNDL
jgi:hypothetical protein